MTLLSRRTLLLGGALAVASYLVNEADDLRVVRYTVPVRHLPPPFHGFTILHLSDLHQKLYGEGEARLLPLIRRHRYDLVAVTGDLVNRSRPDAGPALALIRGMAPRPLFCVNGNNEADAERRRRFRLGEELAGTGAVLLDNAAVPLRRGGSHLWVAGVDDPVSGRSRLERTLAGTADGAPRLLLTHSPSLFPQAVAAGVELILAGHTHGGQIRFPGVGALWVPDLGVLPRWDYGEFREGGSTMIVNGGLGESLLPFRVNMPPEIVLVTLVA